MHTKELQLQQSALTAIVNTAPIKIVDCPQAKMPSKRDLLRSANRKQIEQMMDKVKQQISRNKKKYEQLININPYFSIKLYQPHNQHNQEDNLISIKILMQQIDLLMDEAHFLDTQIKKCELKRMQSDHVDPTQREEVKHHFSFLRKMWVEASKVQSKNDLQRIEQLNKRVVLIKNNVLQLHDHERNCYSITQKLNYSKANLAIKQAVEKSMEFMTLKQNYQNSMMKHEDMQVRVALLCDRHRDELAEKDKDIAKLIRQNDEMRRQNQQLKEKMITSERKEMKLIEKISKLQQQIREKPKLESFSTPNIINTHHSHFAQLKFRKIQVPQNIIIQHHPANIIHNLASSHKTIMDTTTETEQFSGRLSLPLHSCEQRFQNNQQESHSNRSSLLADNNKQESNSNRSSLLADNKSVDDKKGRFIRMRSPGNNRLMKDQKDEYNLHKSRVTHSSSTNSIPFNQK